MTSPDVDATVGRSHVNRTVQSPGRQARSVPKECDAHDRTDVAVRGTSSCERMRAMPNDTPNDMTPSQLIDARIEELGDWRGAMLKELRTVIRAADPQVVEEWKWRGVPVFEHDGIICTGETYKSVVKLTFFKGAALPDPAGLFNSSLEGNTRRAIDFHEGDAVDREALKELVLAAVALNTAKPRR